MNTITQEQIKQIEDRLFTKYDLKYDHFRDELVDHLACEVEERMDKGENFEEAFTLVFRKWNVRLIADKKGRYKNIPHFMLHQLNAEFKKVEILSFVLAMGLSLALLAGAYYVNFNSLLLLGSLFAVNILSVWVIHRELQNVQDYRRDFFKAKSKVVLLRMGIVLTGITLFTVLWGPDASSFSLQTLVLYYFIFNSFLLARFRTYCNNHPLKIAK